MTHAPTLPPGPRNGRGTANAADYAMDPLGFLTGAAREFGDVVALTPSNVLLAHPDDIGRVLLDRGENVIKISPTTRRKGTGFPLAMMNSEGEDWERKRTRIRPAFRSERLSGLEEHVHDGVERTVGQWRDGQVVDVHHEMSYLAMRIGAEHIAGRRLGERGHTLARAVAAIMRLTSAPRLPRWLPTPVNRELKRSMRTLDSVLAELISEHRPGESETALDRLLNDGAPFAEVRDELATLLMSGYETTADALTWLVHLLGENRRAEARMGEEGFALAAAKEAMRLYPPAWVISRETVAPFSAGGYTFAPGTVLGLSQWVTHRDGRWFRDPEEFRPQRWLTEGAVRRHAYFPFGSGPRGCVGASMALREVEVIASQLYARVRLEPVAPHEVRPQPALALRPVGVKAVVRR